MRDIAESVRAHRTSLGWRQQDLADRSGVAVATLRRFERTGQIGLQGFAKLIVSLGLADTLVKALKAPSTSPTSIDSFLAAAPSRKSQRVRLRKPSP